MSVRFQTRKGTHAFIIKMAWSHLVSSVHELSVFSQQARCCSRIAIVSRVVQRRIAHLASTRGHHLQQAQHISTLKEYCCGGDGKYELLLLNRTEFNLA